MSEIKAVWLAMNTGYDHGSVEAILLDREDARRWIEDAHRAAVAHGEHMEEFNRSEGCQFHEEGEWLPTPIKPIEDAEGWCFDDMQSGSGHGHTSIRRVELPYEREMVWLNREEAA